MKHAIDIQRIYEHADDAAHAHFLLFLLGGESHWLEGVENASLLVILYLPHAQ